LNGWVKQRNNLAWNIKSVPLRELQILRRLSVGKLGGSELVRLVSAEMGTGQRVISVEIEIYACIIWSRKTFWF
jgi:hypothetical protein